MKENVFIPLILALVLSSSAEELDPDYNYETFMVQFERIYQGQQKLHHEQIFNINYAELLRRNKNGQDVAVNDFLDWNETQKAAFFNYKPGNYNIPVSSKPLRSSALFSSPTSFDWRSLARVTPVKYQGSCGSCWAFSSTAQYQSLLAINTNGTLYDLAEQYAVQCQTKDSNGCNGGIPVTALELFNKTGIPLQSSFPYKAKKYYKKNGYPICSQQNSTIKLSTPASLIQHYSDLSVQNIQQDLVNYGPLSVAVYAGNDDFMYTGASGEIACSESRSIDHAVLLVGYNATHWFIKNSWGTSWGDEGFAYIKKNKDCQLHSWVDVMQVTSSTPSPSPSPFPTPTDNTILKITMVDSYGDGWNGNVFALTQDDKIIAKFGSTFTKGSSSSVSVTVPSQKVTKVIVSVYSDYPDQVGFTITRADGTVAFKRNSGQSYTSNAVFTNFCPTLGCAFPNHIDYYVTLTSTKQKGWKNTVLGFRQNGNVISFGEQFTDDSQYGPIVISLIPNVKVDIIVLKLGKKPQIVGFVVRDYQGNAVFTREPAAFSASSILGNFTPGTVSFIPVEDISTHSSTQEETSTISGKYSDQMVKSLIVTTVILAAVVLAFFIISAILFVKMLKSVKNSKDSQSVYCSSQETAKKISEDENNMKTDIIH